ncbi:MAG: insulinase family protein [Tissierellia bacterium]|nr:insulinase family protein [Tissierellia bacterium]
MVLKPERININKGISLNLIKMDKFKSNLLSLYLIIPLNREEVTKNALLPLVLKRGTKELNTNLKIQRKLEELYGSELNVDVNKTGEKQVIRFTIEGPKGRYVNDEKYMTQIIDLLKSLVYNPYLEKDAFGFQYVKQEKENLKRLIEARINDKRSYAIGRCIEEMYINEKFSIYPLGYIEDLDSIDNKILYEHYNKILDRVPIEIFYVGEYDNELTNYLIDSFRIEREDVLKLERESITSNVQTKNMIHEDMDINQGKLVLGYRTGIPYDSSLYNGLLVGSDILGGGPNSKLFRNVREAESLAYYIGSKVYKYKSLMIIDGGIDSHNLEKTIEIIRFEIDNMKKGIFTQEDIDVSKKSIKASMESIKDSIFLISEFFFSRELSKDGRTLEEALNDIERVTKEDIIESSNKINLDTIYFLRNLR